MKILLDTHAFLWFVSGSNDLSEKAMEIISDPVNEPFISIGSLWEISIKTAIGKLEVEGGYDSVINDVEENGIGILPISFIHTARQNKLPFHHRDPFDRIIVAQAIVESMDFVSRDEIFDLYMKDFPVNRIW